MHVTYAYRRNHQLKLCDQLNEPANDRVRSEQFATALTTPHYENK